MRCLCVVAVFAVLAAACHQVACLTNRDVFDFVRQYGRVVDVEDGSGDVLVLPGDIDDDLDLDYIVQKLGLQAPPQRSGIRFWHIHHHHHHHHHQPEFHCSCTKDDCKCCIKHKFHFFGAHYELEACMAVTYDPEDHKVTLDFTINGHTMYKHEVSLNHVAKLCFKVPGLGDLATVCLEIYDVDLAKLHACARLTGTIDLKVHKFHVHLKLGCFSVPISEQLGFFRLPTKKDCLTVEVLPKTAEDSEDVSEKFRALAEENWSEE